jgi:ABC-type branched-subunit amino acid transport system substrate-binding protein
MALQSLHSQAGGPLKRLALLALLSLSIAGCQLVPRSGDRMPAPAEAPVVDEEDQPGPALPPGETRNRVAVLVPLTGSNAAVGQSIANAANLALADLGSERVRITAYDTAPGPLAAVNQALADGNGLFLGPLLAEDARAIAPIARRANVPVIAFSNDVSIAGDGVYVLGLNPGQSIEQVVEYARSRGARRFGALLPASVYGERAGRAFTEAVQRAGGEVVGVETYNRTPETLRAAATALAGQGPFDAVLVADSARLAAVAVPILRRGSPQLRILGTELWATEANVGAQAALRGAWFAAPNSANFEQLRTRYRARFGANPYRLGSLGYDAVLLAVRVAEDWRFGRRFPARQLRTEDGFVGVDGAFRFGRDGVAERALAVQEVTASGTNVLVPAPADFRN